MIHILAYEVERANWSQATARLADVERLLEDYGQNVSQHLLWWKLLENCRQRLKEGLQESKTPETIAQSTNKNDIR